MSAMIISPFNFALVKWACSGVELTLGESRISKFKQSLKISEFVNQVSNSLFLRFQMSSRLYVNCVCRYLPLHSPSDVICFISGFSSVGSVIKFPSSQRQTSKMSLK